MERDVTEGEFTILIDQPLLETGTVIAAESRLKTTQKETLCSAVRLTEYRYQEKM